MSIFAWAFVAYTSPYVGAFLFGLVDGFLFAWLVCELVCAYMDADAVVFIEIELTLGDQQPVWNTAIERG